MKIAVIGAGVVGGYFGARLAAAGNEVHFVARGAHLHGMLTSGLKIKSVLGDFRIHPVDATDRPAEIGPVDLAIFCTKAFDTETAARQCMPLVAANTTVLSLQNDVVAADQLSRILGAEHVLTGATWLSSAVEAPGVSHHVSDSRRVVVGEADGGNSHRLREVVRVLNEAGIAAESSSNIQGVLWSKFVFTSAVAGFGSLTRAPVGAYPGVSEARQLLIALMEETAAVATSLGARIARDAVDVAPAYIDNLGPGITASRQLDVEAGRR